MSASGSTTYTKDFDVALLLATLILLHYFFCGTGARSSSMRNQSLAAPTVSFQYGLASYELSAEGLLRHSLSGRGLQYL